VAGSSATHRGVDGIGAGGPAEMHLHPLAHPLGQHRQLGVDELVLHRGREVQAVGVAHEAARRLGQGDRQVAGVGAGVGLPAPLAGQQGRRPRAGQVALDVRAGQGRAKVKQAHDAPPETQNAEFVLAGGLTCRLFGRKTTL
jgi:hypothetical protein